MNMYEAVKLAAAHIARYPQLYSFETVTIPPDGQRGTACMLGRIAQIVGFQTCHANEVAPALLKIPAETFFASIARNLGHESGVPSGCFDNDPTGIGAAMLKFAEEYRAHLQALEYPPWTIPKSVRDIFNPNAFDGLFLATIASSGGMGGTGGAGIAQLQKPKGGVYSLLINTYEKA